MKKKNILAILGLLCFCAFAFIYGMGNETKENNRVLENNDIEIAQGGYCCTHYRFEASQDLGACAGNIIYDCDPKITAICGSTYYGDRSAYCTDGKKLYRANKIPVYVYYSDGQQPLGECTPGIGKCSNSGGINPGTNPGTTPAIGYYIYYAKKDNNNIVKNIQTSPMFYCANANSGCILDGNIVKYPAASAEAVECNSSSSTNYGFCYSTSSSLTIDSTPSTPTPPPIEVVPNTPSVDNSFKAGYYYAQSGAGYSGDTIYCGDKLYVSSCDSNGKYCDVTRINGVDVKSTTKVYKDKISGMLVSGSCNAKIYLIDGTKSYTSNQISQVKSTFNCGHEISISSSLGDLCNNGICRIPIYGEDHYIMQNSILQYKPTCEQKVTCTDSAVVNDLKGNTTIKVCYTLKNGLYIESNGKSLDSRVKCATNYTKANILKENTCADGKQSSCYKTYDVTCSYTQRPSVSSTGSIVRNDGYGTLTFNVTDNGNHGIAGYFISNGNEPTVNSVWEKFDAGSLTGRENLAAGTYFVYAMNKKERISFPSMSKIYDADISTTLKEFQIKSPDGEIFTANPLDDGKVAYNSNIVDRQYVMLSNALKNDSVLAAFDSLKTAYELNVNKNKIAIYATLTSSDASYVDGYEPRTIDLDYGRNVELIKIVNKKGKERTYTFIINRVDDRENNNLLKDITLSVGDIEFNPYVSDYNVKVPTDTKSVSINGTLENVKATFVKGYEPRTITLNDDQTSAVLKTISEAGIVRSYVITFIKDDSVTNKPENSVYVSSLSIPGTNLVFDRDTYSYTVSVGYEIEELPVFAFAESENATVDIKGASRFKVGTNVIEIIVKNNSKTKIYTIYVIRKESGLTVGDNTTLETLTVKDYDIDFNPNVLDYNVKIKREKTLLITATPQDNRSEVYMYGNNDLNAFSSVRIKVIAENGNTKVYSLNIEKDVFNQKLEVILASAGVLILIGASIIIVIRRKNKKMKEYMED